MARKVLLIDDAADAAGGGRRRRRRRADGCRARASRPTTVAAARASRRAARASRRSARTPCALRGAGARDVRAAVGVPAPRLRRAAARRGRARARGPRPALSSRRSNTQALVRAGASPRDALPRPPPRRRGAGYLRDGGARGRRGNAGGARAPADVAYDEAPSDDDAAAVVEAATRRSRSGAASSARRASRAPATAARWALLATVKPRARGAAGPRRRRCRGRARGRRERLRRAAAAHVATPAPAPPRTSAPGSAARRPPTRGSRARAPGLPPAPSLWATAATSAVSARPRRRGRRRAAGAGRARAARRRGPAPAAAAALALGRTSCCRAQGAPRGRGVAAAFRAGRSPAPDGRRPQIVDDRGAGRIVVDGPLRWHAPCPASSATRFALKLPQPWLELRRGDVLSKPGAVINYTNQVTGTASGTQALRLERPRPMCELFEHRADACVGRVVAPSADAARHVGLYGHGADVERPTRRVSRRCDPSTAAARGAGLHPLRPPSRAGALLPRPCGPRGGPRPAWTSNGEAR